MYNNKVLPKPSVKLHHSAMGHCYRYMEDSRLAIHHTEAFDIRIAERV